MFQSEFCIQIELKKLTVNSNDFSIVENKNSIKPIKHLNKETHYMIEKKLILALEWLPILQVAAYLNPKLSSRNVHFYVAISQRVNFSPCEFSHVKTEIIARRSQCESRTI